MSFAISCRWWKRVWNLYIQTEWCYFYLCATYFISQLHTNVSIIITFEYRKLEILLFYFSSQFLEFCYILFFIFFICFYLVFVFQSWQFHLSSDGSWNIHTFYVLMFIVSEIQLETRISCSIHILPASIKFSTFMWCEIIW